MTRLPGPRSPLEIARWSWRFLRQPPAGIEAFARRYGPVAEFGFGQFRYTYLFGAEANEAVLAHPERFRWREAFETLVPIDGPTALVVSDGDDHARRRRLVAPAFAKRRVDGLLPLVREHVGATVGSWRQGDYVVAHQELRAAIRRIVVRALFGEELAARADELGERLEPVMAFVNLPLVRQVRLDLPGTAWRRTLRAKASADELIFAEIARRRLVAQAAADPDAATDVLDWLIAAGDEQGGLDDAEIRDQVVSLVAAGYDTTSAAAAWLVRALATEPGILGGIRTEFADVVGDGPLQVEHLPKLAYIDGVVSEVLRLWPAGFVSARAVAEPFEVAGHRIEAGTTVVFSPYVTGRDESLWPDPLAFRPERWVPGRAEFAEPVPYSFIPFGWGARHCLGFALARLELTVIAVEVARRVNLTYLGQPGPAITTGQVSMQPADGVPVRITTLEGAAR